MHIKEFDAQDRVMQVHETKCEKFSADLAVALAHGRECDMIITDMKQKSGNKRKEDTNSPANRFLYSDWLLWS